MTRQPVIAELLVVFASIGVATVVSNTDKIVDLLPSCP